LKKKKEDRLGFEGGSEEILKHPWFSDLDLDALLEKTLEPPLKPELKSEIDTSNFNAKSDYASVSETYIPRRKVEEIKKYDDQFKDFAKTKKID
jgi:hypothetical protein